MGKPTIAQERAKVLASAAVKQPAHAAAAYLVERLDGGNPYFLVTFGTLGSEGAIAAVDALTGDVMSSARLDRMTNPWVLDEATAIELSGCSNVKAARLVWRPSRATLSILYPLWEVASDSGRAYVGRDGTVYDDSIANA